jgi:16S rRNA (guanine527-N7)-methyltransferase
LKASGRHPESLIREGARELDVALDDPAVDRLLTYLGELTHWNRKINLVGPCGAETAVDRHLLDALALLRLLDRPEVKSRVPGWLDVGSGAGLPGLVLAIARPAWRYELCESSGKRAAFLRAQVGSLGLGQVRVHATRAEALDPTLCLGLGAMSRATFPPERWVPFAARLVGPEGLVLVSLGSRPAPDLEARAWLRDDFELPFSKARRANLVLPAHPG